MSTTNAAAPMTDAELDQLSINTIRTLSIDAVERAKSGHPGTPMALAPAVYTIWNRVMRFDPQDPIWPNRDRFVLSNGHASMLLWSVLHLTGTQAVNADYERLGQPSVSLDDIRRFRQIGSKAPGHPEYHWVSGVETTSGPLGQGVATSVGMAIAEKWLADRYNRPGFAIFDYDIYVVCGDGCLMEGVASEAASLAGHLGLDNLCWIYDNNHITIEGDTSLAFTEDVATRFLAYGWNVLRVGDANDLERIEHALSVFRETTGRPTLIILAVTSAMARRTSTTPPRPTASRSVKRRFASPSVATDGRRRLNSWSPTACESTSRPALGRVAPRLEASGPRSSRHTEPPIRSSRPRSIRCNDETCRQGGIATFPCSRPTPRASPAGRRRARCSTSSRRTSRGCSAARRTSGRQTRPP